MLTKKLAALAAILLLSGLSACAEDRPRAEDESTDAPTTEATEPTDTATTCEYPSDGTEPARDVEPPPAEPAVSGTVHVTFKTTVGDLNVEMDADKTPCTVNSFVSLAKQDFYDDTPCPRLGSAPGFGILQCGDPTGTGSGGAGYRFADELTGDETYPAGTLAMANGGPDTNGTQFFFVFADSGFPPSYTVFGTFDKKSIKILEGVAAKGDDGSHPAGGGAPNKKVDITDVVIH